MDFLVDASMYSNKPNSGMLLIQSKARKAQAPLLIPIYGVKSGSSNLVPKVTECSLFNSSACGFVRSLGMHSHLNQIFDFCHLKL